MREFSNEEKEFPRANRRYTPSLFGPIVLIALGVYFLLSNLGLVSGLNWMAALQLWPLLLIFIGLNVIVRQAPGRLGALLSALVGLLTVAVFGYVLLFGADTPLFNRLGVTSQGEVQTEAIAFAADDVSSAVINIDFGFPSTEVYALEDSPNLIEGTVAYAGNLIFNHQVNNGRATVTLRTRDGNLGFLNPAAWGEDRRWQIGLNPTVETDLTFNMGAGSARLDLSQLTLSHLDIDGGAGSVELMLPGGDYDVVYDVGAGSSQITLPADGRHTIEIDGGAGSINLSLPSTMEARVEIDSGLGSFSVDSRRLPQMRGDSEREGIWETPGYDDAPNRVHLLIDIGLGSVRVSER